MGLEMAPGAPRRGRPQADGLARLLSETQDMVARLLEENRLLRAQNKRLADELERFSRGWDEVRRLARSAPRGRGGR
jgi:hypothetical protein